MDSNKPTDKHIKMAKGVAFDPRYRAGNMTGAVKTIEKIKKGLSSHPAVKKALRSANEEVEITEANVRKLSTATLQKHWNKHKNEESPAPAFAAQLKHVASELKRRKGLQKEELLPKQKEIKAKLLDNELEARKKERADKKQAGTKGAVSAIHRSMERSMTKEAVNPALAPHKHMAKKASPFHQHTNQLVYTSKGKQEVRPIDNSDAGYGGQTVADAEGGEADAGKASKKASKPMKMPTLVKPLVSKEEVEQIDEAKKTKKEKLKALLYRDRSNVREFGKSAGLTDAQKAKARKAIAKEEVEQVDELHKSTLSNYIKSATRSVAATSRLQRGYEMTGHDDAAKDMRRMAHKRMGGIGKAAVKLAKEENGSDVEEKTTMAQTQLHFLKYAAEEMLEYIDMGGEVEEWYQNKLSKVHSEVESLHSYMEGEKRRLGMEEDEDGEEETNEAYRGNYPGARLQRDHMRTVKHPEDPQEREDRLSRLATGSKWDMEAGDPGYKQEKKLRRMHGFKEEADAVVEYTEKHAQYNHANKKSYKDRNEEESNSMENSDKLKRFSNYKIGAEVKEETLDEVAGTRGRPKKGTGEESDRHIIMQLRSAIDLPGEGGMSNKEIKFRGGKKGKVSMDHAKKILKMHDHPNTKPIHKRMLRVAIAKSPEHLARVAKEIP